MVTHLLLRNLIAGEPNLNPQFDLLFDAARPQEARGGLPPLAAIVAYRDAVAQRTHMHLTSVLEDSRAVAHGATQQVARLLVPLVVSLINHEQTGCATPSLETWGQAAARVRRTRALGGCLRLKPALEWECLDFRTSPGDAMIQRQLKLRLSTAQEAQLDTWLWHLTGVWNWAIRKLELDAQGGRFYTRKAFHNLLAHHSPKLGIPSHTLQGLLDTAYTAWHRCVKKLAKKPRLKGQRNQLTSIPFPDPFQPPARTRIPVPGMGLLRFHAQALPAGRIKGGRIVKRASGWYLCLVLDAPPQAIAPTGEGAIGIDPGFQTLLTLSTGEKIAHPQELRQTAQRLAQAQRGGRARLAARLHERLANQRKDRNHKLSRRLVAANQTIVWSKDNIKGLARAFGKSVASAAHAQLRSMLAYKCTASGRQYVEVPSRFSTKTCAACGSLSGPAGYAGLRVRQW